MNQETIDILELNKELLNKLADEYAADNSIRVGDRCHDAAIEECVYNAYIAGAKAVLPNPTISGWISRDSERAGNSLHFHRNEIERGKFYWENKTPDRPIGESLILPGDMFPSLTWQDEPIEVEITIKQ